MLRLLALSLLALAAPQAAAEQVHPCQAQTPPCSVGRPLPQSYLDYQASYEGLAQTLRELDEQIREAGPGAWETPAERAARRNRTRQPRYHVPYPLSRELLTGAVDPCDSAYASCPPELDSIYDSLSAARRRDDQRMLEYYQRSLRYYYRTYQH